jgi:hypothetical protein
MPAVINRGTLHASQTFQAPYLPEGQINLPVKQNWVWKRYEIGSTKW